MAHDGVIQEDTSLIGLLRARAAAAPDRLAYGILSDRPAESGETGVTCGGLDADARRIGGWLQHSCGRGERALLLLPPGLPFLRAFFGAIYAGLIPIPAPAPEFSRRKRTLPRLQSIVRDADVSLVVSTGETLELLQRIRDDVPELAGVNVIDTDDAPVSSSAAWREPSVARDDIAYLQYTSGSTKSPKGVVLTHANVLDHCKDLRAAAGYDKNSVTITWMPHFHDYGLVEGLILPLQNATPAHVMSPFAFLKRPFAWLDAIGRLRGTHTQAPNFAFDHCVRRIRPEQRERLDLSSLVAISNAAEPINPDVVESFLQTFAPSGLRPEAVCPAYGLAEATLIVSHSRIDRPPLSLDFDAAELGRKRAVPAVASAPSRRIVSCGPAISSTQIAIVDPESLQRCPPGGIGEIWVSTPGVATGYWQLPEDSKATFGARIAGSGEGPFLRTGDMGFLHDGELYIGSRIKDLIIVAGTNYAPQDIEWSVERAHGAVRPGHVAAAGHVIDGGERLIIAAEVERGTLDTQEDHEAFCDAIRRAVSEEHEVQVQAIAMLARASLPKTASGKIQRHCCADFLGDDHPDVLAIWSAERGLRIGVPT